MASLAKPPGGDGLICIVCALLYFCTVRARLYRANTSVQCALACTERTLLYSVRSSVQCVYFCIVCTHLCTAHTSVQCALICTVCSTRSHASLALEDSGSRGRERDSNSTGNLYFIRSGRITIHRRYIKVHLTM